MSNFTYRIDGFTEILPIDTFSEPEQQACYSIGAAAGYPSGQWSRHLVGTDENGHDEPVVVFDRHLQRCQKVSNLSL